MVILNKYDYNSKTEEILKDTSKFKVISGDWFKHIIALEDKLNRIKKKLSIN